MDKKQMKINIALTLIVMLIILLSFSTATYAWFSGNKIVDTNMISSRTSSEGVSLHVSSSGGDSFSEGDTCNLVQVNDTDLAYLMPVSTSDLKTFLYNKQTVDDMAKSFIEDRDESFYYHGRMYLRADVGDAEASSKLNIYLDESERAGGLIASASDNNLLRAARLGLVFNGDYNNAIILKLRDDNNSAADTIYNTVIDGEVLGKDKVLTLNGGKVSAADDPSVLINEYEISFDGSSVSLPDTPLLVANVNEIYSVDVFFYLEGCDPDCSDSVAFDTSDLHLAFYGILAD